MGFNLGFKGLTMCPPLHYDKELVERH